VKTVLGGIRIIPTPHIPRVQRDVKPRPWWHRWLALAWKPWRRGIVVESMPWHQIGPNLYAHPDNVDLLWEELKAAGPGGGEVSGNAKDDGQR